MLNLKIGNTIEMVKPIGKCDMIGCRFKVTDITDDQIEFISKFGIGYMSYTEFDTYFVKHRVWTSWIKIAPGFSYKTDGEKYVRVKFGEYKVKASCNKMDTFDLKTGICVCMGKIRTKYGDLN